MVVVNPLIHFDFEDATQLKEYEIEFTVESNPKIVQPARKKRQIVQRAVESQILAIQITDVNEPPMFQGSKLMSFSVPEGEVSSYCQCIKDPFLHNFI